MTQRIRSTWRTASPAPAMPSEIGGHPASQPDPDVEEYGVGYPTDWAEDPHPGPYGDTPAPAMPSEAGDHPAARTAAIRQRYAAEKKAFNCIMIAERLLGKKASQDVIQRQAMSFMHMEDDMITDTLDNMAMYDDDMDMMDDMDVVDDLYDADDDLYGMDEEEMLATMLAEEEGSEDDDSEDGKTAEQMLAEMLAEEEDADEEAGKEADQNDPDGDTLAPDVEDAVEDAEEEAGKEAGFDPMGLDDATVTADDLFAEYFPDHVASDDEAEEEEAVEAEEEEEEAVEASKKKAAQRPQPRKPSSGPKTLGRVTKAASAKDSLDAIWESAPDISEAFGMKPRS